VTVFGIFASVVDGRVGVQDIENDDVNASTQKSFHTKATQIKELLRGHMTLSTVPTKDPLPPGHPPGPAPVDDNLIAHASDNASIPHRTDEKRLIKIFDNDVMDSELASDAGIAFSNAQISHEEGEEPLLRTNVGQCSDTYNCNCNWDWCHRRALMGTCTSPDDFYGHNSDFMDANCCNSCHIMADNPNSLCVNLHSNNRQCDQWANNGECLRNPLWMRNECCHSCAESCTDTYTVPYGFGIPDCRERARNGHCTTGWVRDECCHSCMLNEAAPSLNCVDVSDNCAWLASIGQCRFCCATCRDQSTDFKIS